MVNKNNYNNNTTTIKTTTTAATTTTTTSKKNVKIFTALGNTLYLYFNRTQLLPLKHYTFAARTYTFNKNETIIAYYYIF